MRRILDQVVGHQSVIENLLSVVRRDRLPPSWLFVGPQDQGKKLIAIGIAQAFLCDGSKMQEGRRPACGTCPACVRVANRQSEGLILIEAEGPTIKIETARQVINDLSLSALGRGRIVIVDEAEKLSAQAANALLKSIEEPPPKTHFILIARSRDSVLATIRSRCQVVRFGSLSHDELAKIGREAADPETLMNAAQLLNDVVVGDRAEAMDRLREQVGDRESALSHLKLWQQFVRDSWAKKSSLSDLRYPELTPKLVSLQSETFEQLAKISRLLLQAERDIQSNSDTHLTFENLVYELD